LDIRSARDLNLSARDAVTVGTWEFIVQPNPTEDRIAYFNNANIVFGEPTTAYADNPKFTVCGKSEFGMNPVLKGTVATSELDGLALITKDQVFDVLNNSRHTPEAPILHVGEDLAPAIGAHGSGVDYYLAAGNLAPHLSQDTPHNARFRVFNILGFPAFLTADPRTDGEHDLFYRMDTGQAVDISVGVEMDHNSVWEISRIPHQGGGKGTTYLCFPIHKGASLESGSKGDSPGVLGVDS